MRYFALILVFLVCGALALRSLIAAHVDQVVIVHTTGIADHSAHMLQDAPDLMHLFHAGHSGAHSSHTLHHIMHATGVFKIALFDADGTLIDMPGAPSPDPMAGFLNLTLRELENIAGGRQPPLVVRQGGQEALWPEYFAKAVRFVRGPDGEVWGYAKFFVDVTQLRQAYVEGLGWLAALITLFGVLLFAVPALVYLLQKRLAERSRSDARYLASHDALTGVLNRHTFMKQAEALIARRRLSAVAYLDADEFKTINDTYGHAAGDAYLSHVAKALEQACSKADLIARFGGDEFVIAFAQPASAEAVEDRLEGIRAACAQDIQVNGLTIGATVSIGAAHVNADLDLDRQLRRADTALYFAKSSGRNVVSIYAPEMSDLLNQRRHLEMLVRQAVAMDGFCIHYQPLVDAGSHETVGYEALLRLQDESGRPVSPADFIPVAEDLGLIEEIGDWVLSTATQEIVARPGTPFIAINLSAEQFKSGGLVTSVKSALAASGLPAARLELEITESLLMEDHTRIGVQIDALKDLGVSIAMDDFGTGYSSLSYLWKFGFDRLKIDQSFAHGLQENPDRSRDLIEAIVMLGDRLGLQITAEGIETDHQAAFLSSLGCHVLQGFYFGVPKPFTADTQTDQPVQQRLP